MTAIFAYVDEGKVYCGNTGKAYLLRELYKERKGI